MTPIERKYSIGSSTPAEVLHAGFSHQEGVLGDEDFREGAAVPEIRRVAGNPVLPAAIGRDGARLRLPIRRRHVAAGGTSLALPLGLALGSFLPGSWWKKRFCWSASWLLVCPRDGPVARADRCEETFPENKPIASSCGCLGSD